MTIALKALQTVATILFTYTTYSILQNQLVRDEYLKDLDIPIFADLSIQELKEPPSDTLLDIKNFEYLLKPRGKICNDESVLFFIVVHSDPSHFSQRSTIRSTWGGLKRVVEPGHTWHIHTVFLLGQTNSSHLTKKILHESDTYDDIIQGSFIDSYYNLTYKHIMGYKWTSTECSQAQFILKADDDAFVDIPGLYLYLVRALGDFKINYSSNFIAGNVFPKGTEVKRNGKWAVSKSDYQWNSYPSYLGGLAYLVTPNLANDLYRAAHHDKIRWLWVDDVFVTGILASSLRVHPFFMNMKYAYDEHEIVQLMRRPKQMISMPYTFVHLDTSKLYWASIAAKLWNNSKTIYNISGTTFYAAKSVSKK